MAVKTRKTTVKQIDFMKATREIGKPVSLVIGFACGRYALKKLTKESSTENKISGYIGPVVVTIGGLAATQLLKDNSRAAASTNYIKYGLIGASCAGVESVIERATGKTILQGLESIEGLLGFKGNESNNPSFAYNPSTQTLPASDIDIEREIQKSISGAAMDFSMSDEPIGSLDGAATDYYEPIGNDAMEEKYQDESAPIIAGVLAPDSMDYDIFSGDMMS